MGHLAVWPSEEGEGEGLERLATMVVVEEVLLDSHALSLEQSVGYREVEGLPSSIQQREYIILYNVIHVILVLHVNRLLP